MEPPGPARASAAGIDSPGKTSSWKASGGGGEGSSHPEPPVSAPGALLGSSAAAAAVVAAAPDAGKKEGAWPIATAVAGDRACERKGGEV